MRKTVNTERFEGRIYEHNLTIKTVQNKESDNYGKEFISGTIDIAIDEDAKNIVQNHFTFVKELTNKGTKNATFANLKKIIDENKTWVNVGKDAAQMVRIDTAIGLNDFYNQNDELVSVKRNEGGFVTLITALPDVSKRNSFTVDMVITKVTRKEANEERNIPEHVVIHGGIFDFRGAFLPVDFIHETEEGMNYFENLDASNSNPIFTQVWGTANNFISSIKQTKKSAFGGEVAVTEIPTNRRVWIVTGIIEEPYDFGGDDLTGDELSKAIQDRETYLAGVKKRSDEWKAQRDAAPTQNAFAAAAATPQAGSFNF